MKVNFFTNFFKSENTDRQKELDAVMQMNLLNPAIDRLISFSARPTYEDFFMEGFSFPKDVNIIANTDIFSDENSINTIKRFYENPANVNTILALSRWDVGRDNKAKHYNDRGSQDVWVFFGNILPVIKGDCKFHLGKPGCDNRIAHILKDSGFRVVNPSIDIRFYHLHNSGHRNYKLEDTVLGNHLLLSATMLHQIHTTEYTERTEEQIRNDIQYKLTHPETIQLNIPSIPVEMEVKEQEATPEPILPKAEEPYQPHTKPRENRVYRGEPQFAPAVEKPIMQPKIVRQTDEKPAPATLRPVQKEISIPAIPIVEKVENRGIKVLHLGVMAGENGFTKQLKNLGMYNEVNVPATKNSVGYDFLQRQIRDMAINIEPDLIFCQLQEDGQIAKETFQQIKKQVKNCVIVTWSGDIRHETPLFIKDMVMSKAVDVACYSNMRDVNNLRRFGNSEFLNIGFDPEIYRSGLPKADGIIQRVCFMGNSYGAGHFPLSQERLSLVESLHNEFRGEFGLYGTGWSLPVPSLNQKDEAIIYNTCKVAISLSHFNEERYFSDRLLRAMGSGCMVISHNYKGIEKDFVVGKDLVIFNDLNDLKAKAHYYLDNPAEAAKIAEAGMKVAHSKHTFADMVNNIFSIYEKYKI